MEVARQKNEYAPADSLGMNRLVHLLFHNADISEIWNKLIERASKNIEDAGALMDLSIILHTRGQTQEAANLQRQALECQRCYRIVHGDGSGLRVLAFVTEGDFMANTPIDFLLNGSNVVLYLVYVDENTTSLDDLPEHDVAFFGIGEAPGHEERLARSHALLAGWQGPLLNGDPAGIARLTRHEMSKRLAEEKSLVSPITVMTGRDELEKGEFEYPIIVRPLGSHAGHGLEKIENREAIAAYLAGSSDDCFYTAPFVDYRGPDGRFAKQRVVLIDGKPFASHLAVSDHWMVHYLNAGMIESPEKRALEGDWMENFDTDFAVRHAQAFKDLHKAIGLDYFGFDCAEASDGRLLVFEVDVALIVHDMDDADIFPYKKPAMRKLFDAFIEMLAKAAKGQPMVRDGR